MNGTNRVKNSLRNAIMGICTQFSIIILNLLTRSIFIKFLSVEYLGINGLFTNILTILSLAELGVGGALVYSMYKPLADKDEDTLKGLMNLYSKAYKIIGFIICIIGLLLIPYLHIFIGDAVYIPNIYIIYILFLLNTVFSYFYAYKRSIISADQKEYINSAYKTRFSIYKCIAQIIVLYLWSNFIIFLIIQIGSTLLENIFISYKADKLYPFLKHKKNAELDKKIKKEIFINVKSLMIYKVCGVLLGGLDNIIISTFIGVTAVGVLSNYTLIVGSVSMVLYQLFNAMTASIGNLIAKDSSNKQELIFDVTLFISFWAYGFCSICLFILINPFIQLWIGSEYLLSELITFTIVFNFYIVGMQTSCWTYRSTMGLFKYGKWRPVVSAIINVVLSIVLAQTLGILGVLMGTVIARIVTNVWYDPIVVYKYGFKKPVWSYYIKYTKYLVITFGAAAITMLFLVGIKEITLGTFIFMMCVTTVVPNAFILVVAYKTKEFKYLLNCLNSLICTNSR